MAESDLIRGNVDTIILKVLYEGDRYGYDLIKQINARGDGQWEIKQPTVYACLKRLEKQGFISSYWDSSESDGGRRKYYSLTEAGREVFLKYKNEYERASALFGGIISGSDVPPIPTDNDFSDVEEEGYAVPKRKPKRKPKPPQPQEEQPIQQEVAEPTQSEQPQNGENVIPQDIFIILEQQQRLQQQLYEQKLAEQQERELKEQQEREERALLEQRRLEEERREQELLEQARRERAERERELLEQAQREQEQLDQELLELRLSEQEQRQLELEQQLEQQRLEHERLEQQLLEHQLEEQLAEREKQEHEDDAQPQNSEPQLKEPLDPKQIIESYYAAESGESFSDAQRKNNLTETPPPVRTPTPAPRPVEKELAPQPTAAPAPAPATVPERATSVPATRRTTEPAPKAPTPPPAPIAYSEEESPARREYKTVLDELVDRFEVTPPDLHDRGAATAEQAATTERAEAAQSESSHLSKVEQSVRELGNNLTVRNHNNSAKEYSGKHYYYCNRLMMTHYTIMCAAMFVLGLTLFLTFYLGLNMRMHYDYMLYIGAGLLPIAMFIVAVIKYATNVDKKKRINVNFKFSVIIRIVIMLQVCVIVYCLNLIWGMPVSFSVGFIPSLVLPAVYALFIPISELIFMKLLKSGNYAVDLQK